MARCLGCMKEHNEKNGVCPYCGYDNNSKPTEAYHIIPGTILEGRYLIGKCVGQGGFGITYIGWDLQLERKIAVKEYFPSDFATRALGEQQLTIYNGEAADQFEAGLKSFIDEAQRLAKFNGIKGIVDIYDTFISNNTGYIIMEFLSGISVKDMLKANGTLDYPTAKEIVVEMLYILNEVHKEGIIHRDIAPDNIFITDEGEFKLLDFGAARYASIVNSKSLSVILKPGYAPAEQYRRRGNQGPWTDIYALAATFYKLITGVTPPESMERINGDNLVPPSKLGVQIPKNDEIILLNALNVMPENRVQNAKEFLDALGGKRAVRKREKKLGADTGKMYKFAIPLLVISLIFVGGFSVYVKAGGIDMEYVGEIVRGSYEIADGFAIVRNVVGKDIEQAEKLLNMDGFKVEIGESIYIDVIDEGKVAAQTPSSGSASTEDTVITLVVSLGAETGDIGAYINRSADEVITELKAAGFYNIDTMPGEKNELPEGIVEAVKSNAEEIAENSQVKLSTPIVLYVSDGSNFEIDETKDVKVPNVTKKKYTDASSTIVDNKLIVGSVSYEYSSSVKEGYVISQSPSAGSTSKEGSSVSLVVSKGSKVTVPSVLNMSKANAISKMSSLGLECSVVEEYSSSVKSGLVIKTSPASGKSVNAGSTVTITVSKGEEPAKTITVPSVSGKSQSSAESSIKKANLKCSVNTQNSDTVKEGYVISQSPSGGSSVKEGATITINVSKGPANKTVSVPNVVGSSESSARNSISSKGLVCSVSSTQYSDSVKEGYVISQNPSSGNVKEGSTVSIVVSKGPKNETVSVPNVVGYSKSDAKSKLSSAGLDYHSSEQYSSNVDKGKVISQSPSGGSQVSKGTTVSFVISKGPEEDETVTVPNVIGSYGDSAQSSIEGKGLKCKFKKVYNDSVKEGYVISQSPSGGSSVEAGTTITVVVSKGSEENENVSVPDVLGKSESSASSKIQNNGLNVSVSYDYSSSVKEGRVISQSPSSGSLVDSGTTVYIVVSKGTKEEEKITVPDVTGKSESSASSKIRSNDLNVSISYQESSSVSEGKVISQSPSGGSSVTAGSTVIIYVSSGSSEASIPSVVGKSESSASSSLSNAGFDVYVNYEYSSSVSEGRVISQSPTGTGKKGSTVTITVSKGAEKTETTTSAKSSVSDEATSGSSLK